MDDVEVKLIADIPTLHEVEHLQRVVWGMPDRDIVPYHQLLAATRAGGAVLGAFMADGRLIGFCYGFVGVGDSGPLFYSHMAGVLKEFRSGSVGFRLKGAQRQFALEQGIDRMVWTFDPLVSMNAHFNLHKLGAVASRYYVNYYGEMPDELNRGLESDRLEVDWWLRDPRVEALMRGDHRSPTVSALATPVLAAVPRPTGFAPGDPALEAESPALQLEIPTVLAEAKAKGLDLARAWRAATRQTFLHYFERGYVAVDFLLERHAGHQRGVYILQQRSEAARR